MQPPVSPPPSDATQAEDTINSFTASSHDEPRFLNDTISMEKAQTTGPAVSEQEDFENTQKASSSPAAGYTGKSLWPTPDERNQHVQSSACASAQGSAGGNSSGGNGSGGTAAQHGPASGAWLWIPEGMEPTKSWRKRHPVLFWGGILLLLLLVFNWGRLAASPQSFGGPKIAIVKIEGMILDAASVVEWIDTVRKDDSYKGAIIYINSPGGAVGPSEEMFQAVKRLAAAKEVVSSMGSIAASGGYYAALGADEIFASPSTITASIGVKMQIPNFEGVMKSVGVSEKTLTTGKLKDAGSVWREMAHEEEKYFRDLIGDMYESFIDVVAKERKMPLDDVKKVADGRAMTGRQALRVKLVDKMGGLYDAKLRVLERCDLPLDEVRFVEGPLEPSSWVKDAIGTVLDIGIEQRAKAAQPMFFY